MASKADGQHAETLATEQQNFGSQPKGVEWTVIVLTCQYKDSVYAFQRELEIRQQKGSIAPGVVLLTVEDPEAHVGSGGATLNALLVAAEHLSARAGYMPRSGNAVAKLPRLPLDETWRDLALHVN